jgi:hypothetical protein
LNLVHDQNQCYPTVNMVRNSRVLQKGGHFYSSRFHFLTESLTYSYLKYLWLSLVKILQTRMKINNHYVCFEDTVEYTNLSWTYVVRKYSYRAVVYSHISISKNPTSYGKKSMWHEVNALFLQPCLCWVVFRKFSNKKFSHNRCVRCHTI